MQSFPTPATPELEDPRERVRYAQLLVELGELDEAEREIGELLEAEPKNLTATNLFAKLKHMRGELSQAIACWAQIHAQSPHNERTLMCLGSLMQFAQSPERGAAELLAFGPCKGNPVAQLELESVFRSFLAHRSEEARAACDRLAAKHRSKDRELYKLAVLAKAWICELSGELEAACRMLESLGTERGFETDTDRVLALARVYEKLGSHADLEKAVHVFHFLERSFRKMSALGKLASLYHKLGDDERARLYGARYEDAFRRRMHRPSKAEAASVLARRFLPLASLAHHPLGGGTFSDAPSLRERALLAFLGGDHAAARELFRRGGELLDTKYEASLSVLEGDWDTALPGLLVALERDPDDMRVVTMLLDRSAAAEEPAIAGVFRSPGVKDRVLANLVAAVRASPLRSSLWRDASMLHEILGHQDEALRCAGRASALEVAAKRDSQTVGRVLAAAVFHFLGKSKGLIHQVWVDRVPAAPGRGGFLSTDDILGNVTFEMKQSIRNTFFAVREYARSRFPLQTGDILDYGYTYKITKEDERSGGTSAGLPTALAFLSVFLQRPVPQDMAFSGVVIADAHDVLVVRSVGEAEYKAKGAFNRNLRMVVLPAENRVDLEASVELPGAIREEIVRYVRDLDEAVELTFGDDVWVK